MGWRDQALSLEATPPALDDLRGPGAYSRGLVDALASVPADPLSGDAMTPTMAALGVYGLGLGVAFIASLLNRRG